ncbi:MAG: preprotein translocase subunit SecE [Candidatus Symbiothrix sp.]|jgi:preprotein translocase subunit SecE|nr:preprotein translocase subunit SecE [Candidatus Symbiothrix sp.]
MNRIVSYIKECYNELVYKVSWPSRQELSSSTIVVMVASLILAVIVFAIDKSFEGIVSNFYKIIF